ncbi:MAG: right-handed parallel beta-helix repeat-containing protein [Gammaproteobacteria bacterium]
MNSVKAGAFPRPAVRLACATVVALLGMVSVSTAVAAAPLWVSNAGVDSATCGASETPCRSITQAIRRAAANDTILVRPGHYGDNNFNGREDAGDEEVSNNQCMVCIRKPLRLQSTKGASLTTIDASGGGGSIGVLITASNVTFGATGRGFTVTGARNAGVIAYPDPATQIAPRSVKVSGNIALKNGQSGFSFQELEGNLEVSDNIAMGNGVLEPQSAGWGILMFGFGGDINARIIGNVAVGNRTGMSISGPGSIEFSGNIVNNNESGLSLSGATFSVTDNSIVNNASQGAQFSGTFTSVQRNTVAGNRGSGIVVFDATVGTFRSNNLYGNGSSSIPVSGDLRANCGLVNATFHALIASNNYWGSPQGPGSDPADDACAFDGTPAPIVAPIATQAFPITP